jgi:integrase
LKKINTDPVRRRRALVPEEIAKLLDACLPERKLLYQVALCTGLRANELRHITPAHLDDERCGIRLEAAWTKNRLDGFQPIPRWLMDILQSKAQDLDRSGAFFGVQKTHPARMIQDDLKRAGIPLEIPGEGKVDFHSLRVTFCSLLDDRGASAKENQELARHSTPVLTMNVYVRTRVDRVRGVVDAVGEVVNPAAVPELCPNGQTPQLRFLRNAG